MDKDQLAALLEERKRLKQEISRIESSVQEHQEVQKHWESEGNRIYDLLYNSEQVIAELSDEFKEKTVLQNEDVTFLFLATALQCIRFVMQPKVTFQFEKIPQDQRHNASQDGKKLDFDKSKQHSKKYKEVKKSHKYPDRKQILLYAVPYDAMNGTEHVVVSGVTDIGKNLYGGNHHSATMGHDPVLGYIFGTLNILTRTITYKNAVLETNLVHLSRFTKGADVNKLNHKGQYVSKGNIGIPGLLERTCETLSEDIMRLPAAIVKQYLHMQSDKYTKHGLPIPFISPEKAQHLLDKGWNSNELERLSKFLLKNTLVIGAQAILSILINVIIETLYKLVKSDSEEDEKIVEVKTRKILMYSNVMASTSNVIQVAVTKNINNLDVGGLAVTLYRIATDTNMIKEIRNEYVYGGFEKQLQLREYEKGGIFNEY